MAGNPAFGKKIRDLRLAKQQSDSRFSLRQFAQQVGISATFLSKVETGEFAPPAADKIKKMAQLLGVDSDELLALANKIDPELSQTLVKEPLTAVLLRKASALSNTELQKIIQTVDKKINQQKKDTHEQELYSSQKDRKKGV